MRFTGISLNLKDWNRDDVKRTALMVLTKLARTSLPEILLVSTYIISRYLPNADFSYPYELLMPIALFAVLISIFYYAYRLIFKRALTAHAAALPLTYSLYNYGDLYDQASAVLKPVLPDSLETAFTMSLLAVLGAALVYGLAAFLIVKLARRWPSLAIEQQLFKIALFIITFNFAVQAVVLGNYLFQTRNQLSYSYDKAPPVRKAGTAVSTPDIYYLVFDRYANSETLQRTYGYDNTQFTNYLSDQQFVTRKNSYANYPYTMSSIGSTLAMDYVPQLSKFATEDKQTGFPYRSILNDPPVVRTLKENGYKYNLVSSWWDFLRIGVKPDSEPTKSYRLRIAGHNFYQSDFSRDVINRTVLSPLLKKGLGIGGTTFIRYELDRDPTENFESQISALGKIAKGDSREPQFTFAHILLPHEPYVYNADGSKTTYSHDRNDDGEDEYVKYTNQVTYANKRIEELINTIKTSSPDAVIIFQSDEGPYPKQFRGALTKEKYYDPKVLPEENMKQKMSILASYYFPGVDKSKVAANMNSNVNAFRFVLSQYMGYDLPPLPDCNLSMGNKFDLFSYTLLNKQLKGEDAAKQCDKYVR